MDTKEILSKMTLRQKASMCAGKNFWETYGIDRLGVPSLLMTDGPQGLRKQTGTADNYAFNDSLTAVCFPTGSCIASSFDRDLIKKMGQTLGNECQAEGISILLGPAINIKRSPLCGRNFEYFSEDPYISGELACAYTAGVQSEGVGVCPKHFTANNQEHRRLTGSSEVDERTLREIYFPAFEKVVKEENPVSIMSSYNKLNGVYTSENKEILTNVLRDEWGFDGIVISDWGSVNNRVNGIYAGMDLEMPNSGKANEKAILKAARYSKPFRDSLDTSVERILNTVHRLKRNKKDHAVFNFEADHDFAVHAAAESMVLLKNEGMLPLSRGEKTVFIGEFAKSPRYQGNGSSFVNPYKVESSLEAASDANVMYAQGYSNDPVNPNNTELLEKAVAAAKDAGCAVIFAGLPDRYESEGYDRRHMKLPEYQNTLIRQVAKVCPKTTVVIQSGSPVEMPWKDNVNAILFAYLGGEGAGKAIVQLLYGEVNPSGKLAETFPLKLEDNPSYLYYFGEEDVTEYREGVFVGYRYYDKKDMEVAYPFGHGLSYTQFEYSDILCKKNKMMDSEKLNVSIKIKNTGERAGKEVVQLYVGDHQTDKIRPIRELKGFEKITLEPGEEKTVNFTLDKRSFAYYDTDISDWHVKTGRFTIYIGASSRDIREQADVTVISSAPIKKPLTPDNTLGDVYQTEAGCGFINSLYKIYSTYNNISGKSTEPLETLYPHIKDIPMRNLTPLSAGLMPEWMVRHFINDINKKSGLL